MSNAQFIGMVIVMAIAVQLTRGIPFAVFGQKSELPKIIEYLGKVLPAAMMGLLVVYCFKDYNYSDYTQILPAIAGAVTVVGIHLWKRNTVLSIAVGTAVYMVLLRII